MASLLAPLPVVQQITGFRLFPARKWFFLQLNDQYNGFILEEVILFIMCVSDIETLVISDLNVLQIIAGYPSQRYFGMKNDLI